MFYKRQLGQLYDCYELMTQLTIQLSKLKTLII